MTENIDKIIEAFWGYELFYVGGAVRDSLMEIESHDIDLATNATPYSMITTCKSYGLNFRYTENSIAHGTITIEGIEVTTFRKEISWSGHNAVVEWATTIEEDLSRRDFTINAIAVNAFTNETIDPFNGKQDIKNKIIRAVGSAQERLNEDPDRALRAVRFANRFDFEIDIELEIAIRNTNISNLSIERVREEFMKILETRHDNYILNILYKVIPEFGILDNLDGGDKHGETVNVHSLWTMRNIMEVSSNPLLIFAGLLHDIGKFYTKDDPERQFKSHEDIGAEKVKEIMLRMKFSNEEISYVYTIIKNHMRWHFYNGNFEEPSDKAIRKAIRDIPDNFNKEHIITDLNMLTWADCQSNLLNSEESYENYTKRRGIYNRALEFLKVPEIKVGKNLDINGNDLIEMGYKPSPLFNTILKDIEEKIFNNEINNIKNEIKEYISNTYTIN